MSTRPRPPPDAPHAVSRETSSAALALRAPSRELWPPWPCASMLAMAIGHETSTVAMAARPLAHRAACVPRRRTDGRERPARHGRTTACAPARAAPPHCRPRAPFPPGLAGPSLGLPAPRPPRAEDTPPRPCTPRPASSGHLGRVRPCSPWPQCPGQFNTAATPHKRLPSPHLTAC